MKEKWDVHRKIWLLTGLWLLLTFGASACSPVAGLDPQPTSSPSLDPFLLEFYKGLGGENVMGPVISEPSLDGERRQQYTQNALLIYDPGAPSGQNWRLEALGSRLLAGAFSGQSPEVAEPFRALYAKLGGQAIVGAPITGLRCQPDQQRCEQYFENLAFFVPQGAGVDRVGLLALGAWSCDYQCRSQVPQNSLVTIYPETAEPFQTWVKEKGVELAGLPLSPMVTGADGLTEQVFENVVLTLDPSGAVQLRNLPERIGLARQQPVAQSVDASLVFYPIADGLGYNIRHELLLYIKGHGGFSLVGSPLGEMAVLENGVYRQCFTHLCLEFDPAAAPSQQVRPAALGYTYRRLNPPLRSDRVFGGFDIPGTVVKVWESHPAISPEDGQEIGVLVLQGGYPVAGAALTLRVFLPGQDPLVYNLRLTGSDGQAHQALPPILAANATLIAYQVCPTDPAFGDHCVEDSFMIWSER